MNGQRLLLLVLVVLTILRWWMGSLHELQEDETYYFQWAQHPALSYYSKGPGVSLAIQAGTFLIGDTEWGVRFFAPLLALGSSLLAFRLVSKLYDEIAATWAVLLLNVIPIFNAGSMLMTIDSLSIFFWAAFLVCFWEAMQTEKRWSAWWILAGLALGLGFLAKYTAFLQLLGVALLLLGKPWRKSILKPGLGLMLVVMALATLPVWIWNSQNGWITFRHLQERGKLDQATGFHPADFLEYLGAHAGVYSPILFAGLCWALYKAIRQIRVSPPAAYLSVFALPIIALYFIMSFREAGEANWTSPGFFVACLLLAHYWKETVPPASRWQWAKHTGLALAIVLSLAMVQTDLLRAAGLGLGYTRDKMPPPLVEPPTLMQKTFGMIGDPSQRMRGWRESAKVVKSVIEETTAQTGKPLFLIANRWQSASALAFYLDKDTPIFQPTPEHPRVHPVQKSAVQNQYSFWPRYDERRDGVFPFEGQDALFITDDYRPVPRDLRVSFASIEPLTIAEIHRGGMMLRRLQFYLLRDYVRPTP